MMHPSQKYLDPNELAKLRGLELRARRLVDGFLAGRHRSTGKGLSLEFTEHREYSPGDDWQHVDWKIYGRTDKYYLKQFEDESRLACYLLVDCSESMSYQGPDSGMSKLEYAKCLAASVAWLVLQQRDAIGLVTFNDRITSYRPPSSSPESINAFVELLEQVEPVGSTEPENVLHEFADRTPRRSIVTYVSDCFADLDALQSGLSRLAFDGHDVGVLQILDAAEIDFPFTSITTFHGLEGQSAVTTDCARIAKAYRRRVREYRKHVEQVCNRQAIRFQTVSTKESFNLCLSRYLETLSRSA